jgi:O-antigen ligase
MILKGNFILNTNSLVNLLFLSWLFTIPFGSKIFHLSIGFATLYPSLIIGFLLLLCTIKNIFSLTRIEKFVGLFLIIFLILTIIFSFNVGGRKEALFDLHSIILFNLYYFNLTLTKYTLKQVAFLRIINKGLFFFTLIILIFGILESLFGVHLVGEYTYKLSQGLATVNYTPLFIYDNPNDYLVYSIGISSITFILNKNLFQNKLLLFSVIVLNLFFAHEAMSRFAILVLMVLLFIFLWSNYFKILTFKYFIILLIPIVLLFVSNNIYLGPIITTQLATAKTSLRKNDVILNKENKPNIVLKNKLDSYTVRKNLVLNGLQLYKSSPIFGVGPGQFRYLLGNFKTKYPIDKNNSPHNYFIEMISQFGVIGFFIFTIPFLLFILKTIKGRWNLLFSILVFLYYLESLMPSAFLYLDINWLLFSVIILCYSEDFLSFKSIRNVRFS